jgi:hypothetical protein
MLFLLVLALTGCAPQAKTPTVTETPPAAEAPSVTEAPTVAAEPSPVYTDWSKLTPYEPVREIYTYHAGYHADGCFEPRADYGVLLPYVGAYSVMEQYVIEAMPLYGLVTDKGELVTPPIYAGANFYGDFLLLRRGVPADPGEADEYSGGTYTYTLAAADGSWVHELGDNYHAADGFGLLTTASPDGSLDVWNAKGEVITHFDAALFDPLFDEWSAWEEENGPFVDLADGRVAYAFTYFVNDEYREEGYRLYLDLLDGTISAEPPAGYPRELDYAALYPDPELPEVEGCNYLEPISDLITGEMYFLGFISDEGEGAWHYNLFDAAGKTLVEDVGMEPLEASVILRAGLYSSLEDGFFCFRSLADHSLAFRCAMRTNSD